MKGKNTVGLKKRELVKVTWIIIKNNNAVVVQSVAFLVDWLVLSPVGCQNNSTKIIVINFICTTYCIYDY